MSRGDTLVEVLLGVTVFSMVAVITMDIMNRGMSIAQQSLETTLVRQQVDAQAEMLRYAHDKKTNLWKQIQRNNTVDVNSLTDQEGNLGADRCPTQFENKEFALIKGGSDLSGARVLSGVGDYSQAATYAKVSDDSRVAKSYGLSVKLVRPGRGKESNKYDAYIKACWIPVGSKRPATIGTIVRLYGVE